MIRSEVLERMDLIRLEHPNGDYPSPFLDHAPGECIECDALRALQEETDAQAQTD